MPAETGFVHPPRHGTMPPHDVMERAAQWYALLISGEASAQDRTRWEAWLASHAQHRLAWQYVELVSQRVLAPLRNTPDPQLLAAKVHAVHTRMRSRRRVLAGIGTLAGVGLLAWADGFDRRLPGLVAAWTADYHTGTGDIRAYTLPDGSRVWLNAASALDADMRDGLRRLILVAGEILVDTAHDARPFVVDTPQGRMRALGTRFTVRRELGRTFLAVYDGAVEIRTADDAATQVVPAGRQARFDAAHISATAPADAAREAWSRGELIAWDLSLADVVDELRPYHAAHISLAPEIAQRRVFGTFPLRDVDGALAMLADAGSVHVSRPWPWWISIQPRPGRAGR